MGVSHTTALTVGAIGHSIGYIGVESRAVILEGAYKPWVVFESQFCTPNFRSVSLHFSIKTTSTAHTLSFGGIWGGVERM